MPSGPIASVYIFRIEIPIRHEADRTEGLRLFLVSGAVEVSFPASIQNVVASDNSVKGYDNIDDLKATLEVEVWGQRTSLRKT